MRTFKGVEVPENDAARVEAVRSYEILETPREQIYDDITELAALITGCPVAYISIFDDERSWLKSSYGLPENRPPRPRELSMCAPTICQNELVIVPDLSQNPRYANLPAVINPPNARFYCSMPLINRDAFALGTLCVWDPETKELSEDQQQAMRRLARLVLDRLEQRRDVLELRRACDVAEEKLTRGLTAMERAEGVAHRLLPPAVAARMLSSADVAPRVQNDVTVVQVAMADMPNHSDPEVASALVARINRMSAQIDAILDRHGLDKLRLAGGVYLAAAGLGRAWTDHAERACAAASDIARELQDMLSQDASTGHRVQPLRIGLHSGTVVAAVIGDARQAYDVWGDGVTGASMMCQLSEPGQITLSETTHVRASNTFDAERIGELTIPQKGQVAAYRLLGPSA